MVGLGITSTTIAFAAMFLSPGLAGAAIASVLGNSQPIFAVALAVPLLGERMTPGKQVALVLGTLGVILIATASSGAYGLAGPALALGASLSLAIGSVIDDGARPAFGAAVAFRADATTGRAGADP